MGTPRCWPAALAGASVLLLAACTSRGAGVPAGAGAPNTPPSVASSSPAPSASPVAPDSTSAPDTAAGPGSGVSTWPGAAVSATAIPLGDGRVTTTSPQQGYVYSCTSQFRGGGARHSGPWIDTAAGTYSSVAKVQVAGANPWPSASHSFTVSGANRILATDDLPTGATTGNFPISPGDPAYQYDTNPNSVRAQSFTWTVPAEPSAATTPQCLGLGPIGVSEDGVLFFDALDDAGRDAGAHEVQDSCAGHPQRQGTYHYHTYSPCLATAASAQPGSSTLVGYAADGYGMYVERDSHGDLPTDADLDACHGRTSSVTWDGKQVVMYHYDITTEYPYTLGCYHGTPVNTHQAGPSGP